MPVQQWADRRMCARFMQPLMAAAAQASASWQQVEVVVLLLESIAPGLRKVFTSCDSVCASRLLCNADADAKGAKCTDARELR